MTALIIFVAGIVVFEVLLARFAVDTTDGRDWTYEQQTR